MSQGPPPPPPPPHGDNPRTTAGGSGLPNGKYDIFIIPEHSAGSGFLYLPSLQPNINSFVAGFACALACVVVFQSMAPAIQQWWSSFQGMGNMGIFLLMVAIGLGAWSLGRQQGDSPGGPGHSRGGSEGRRGPFTSAGSGTSGFGGGPRAYSSSPPPPPPHTGPPPHQHGPPPQSGPTPNQHAPPPQSHGGPTPNHPNYQPPPPEPEPPRSERPKPSWNGATPQPGTPKTESPRNAWEKAREETRKREEERKTKEADQKRREDAARRLRELREKEAREREQREKDAKERERKEKEAREREAKEKEKLLQETRLREQREKELRDRVERERQLREKVEKEAKEVKERLERERREREAREAKEKEEEKARKGSTYAYSSVGERMSMWPNGRPPAAPSSQPAAPAAVPKAAPSSTSTSSPTKKPPAPTAKSTAGTEDEYSYRPYDKPKKPAHKKSVSDFSETSWAPSQSTARTTPPPSMRGPYTTKDPDKIVIRAVYCFVNQFAKTPASQLISGLGTVTDGLILRITTEGLFIDDDVRGVPQREWDVKAWTLKLVEVWCPTHSLTSGSAPSNNPGATPANHPFFKTMPGARRTATDRGAPKTLVGDDADAFLVEMLRTCKDTCRLGNSPAPAAKSSSSSVSGSSNSHDKSGNWTGKGLHLLRATVRDQEGKRYMFVLSEEESWKVAVGLQRLRRGTQVRALGVATLSQLEAKNILETLGW